MLIAKESDYESFADALGNEINAKCHKDGLSKEKVLEKLIIKLGYKVPRLQTIKKLTVILNSNTINLLKNKEKEIAERIKQKDRVVSMDTNKARYLIESALMSFVCVYEGLRLNKKDLDRLLGYNERTMRNQQSIYKDKVHSEGFAENIEYKNLCSEIASLCLEK